MSNKLVDIAAIVVLGVLALAAALCAAASFLLVLGVVA